MDKRNTFSSMKAKSESVGTGIMSRKMIELNAEKTRDLCEYAVLIDRWCIERVLFFHVRKVLRNKYVFKREISMKRLAIFLFVTFDEKWLFHLDLLPSVCSCSVNIKEWQGLRTDFLYQITCYRDHLRKVHFRLNKEHQWYLVQQNLFDWCSSKKSVIYFTFTSGSFACSICLC